MTHQEYSEAKKALRAEHWKARSNRLLSTREHMDLNAKLKDDLMRLEQKHMAKGPSDHA